jgi:hypothetical protein
MSIRDKRIYFITLEAGKWPGYSIRLKSHRNVEEINTGQLCTPFANERPRRQKDINKQRGACIVVYMYCYKRGSEYDVHTFILM